MKQQISILSIAYIAIIIATLTACESTDMPIQHPDNYDFITFSAKTEKPQTRTNPYEAYDNTKHPATMGVYAYYGAPNTTIYNNDIVSYNTTTKGWTAQQRKRWDDFIGAKYFDFYAYMPKVEGAKLEQTTSTSGYTYTLSFPFAMTTTDGTTTTAAPAIFDPKEAPIICATPEHKEDTDASGKEFTFERVVNFKFDQTLTAYNLNFKLDPRMGALRQFRIKKVTLSGSIACSGTVSRSYTWNTTKKEWTAGAITWNDINRQEFTNDAPFEIPYVASSQAAAENDNKTILIDQSCPEFTQWGANFYTIPDAQFMPTIAVTYDVVFKDENKNEVITRQDITSTIKLNKENFYPTSGTGSIGAGKTAMINPINILIQPLYLYVLADQDAYTGHLLIE